MAARDFYRQHKSAIRLSNYSCFDICKPCLKNQKFIENLINFISVNYNLSCKRQNNYNRYSSFNFNQYFLYCAGKDTAVIRLYQISGMLSLMCGKQYSAEIYEFIEDLDLDWVL